MAQKQDPTHDKLSLEAEDLPNLGSGDIYFRNPQSDEDVTSHDFHDPELGFLFDERFINLTGETLAPSQPPCSDSGSPRSPCSDVGSTAEQKQRAEKEIKARFMSSSSRDQSIHGPYIDEPDASIPALGRDAGITRWLEDVLPTSPDSLPPEVPPTSFDTANFLREVPLGNSTRNNTLSNQLYFVEGGGPVTMMDVQLMHQSNTFWNDPPICPSIINNADDNRVQPKTSADAMWRFERLCRKLESSSCSKASTCGTRRGSLPDLAPDELTMGNVLMKTSSGPYSGGSNGKISIIGTLRYASTLSEKGMKRKRNDDAPELSASYANPRLEMTRRRSQEIERYSEIRKTQNYPDPSILSLDDPGPAQDDLPAIFPGETATSALFLPHTSTQIPLPTAAIPSSRADKGRDEDHTAMLSQASVPVSREAPEHPALEQVGFARLRVDIVSLSKRLQITCQNDGSDASLSDGEDETGCSQANRDPSSAPGGTPLANPETGTSSGQPDSNRSRDRSRDEDSNEDGGRGQKRRRMCATSACERPSNLPRFACPYQAYEKHLGCLRKRHNNPEGGCKNMSRLKQHFNRRHMMTTRCPRCWVSFDSKAQERSHQEKEKCVEREKPTSERFMSTQHEKELESGNQFESEEAQWWHFFQLLIPNQYNRELSELKTQFSPYYVDPDIILTIPALTFTNPVFNSGGLSAPPGTSAWSHNSADLLASSTPFNIPQSSPSEPAALFSQDFSMPLYQGSAQSLGVYTPLEPIWDDNTHACSTLDPALDMLNTSTIPTSSSSMPSQARANDSRNDTASHSQGQNRTQRNYDRLRQQRLRAETENRQLRERRDANRSDVDRAHEIVDEILCQEQIPEVLYAKISLLSDILETIRGRL
ncbi:uncharacterized protein E0L32_000837 [Thyridium curvatum]|uniref:Uncharacterized protein n=1 Tax=Thyridium curvatum TaxID=1093900 RepID=A0A507B7P3_9PEZI|nr:uncharacterized protein E0L32_000837 [Thyridium curvatum]TPX12660.1 hypothetical protein E0L32_000837 [Thyridium curvatum]